MVQLGKSFLQFLEVGVHGVVDALCRKYTKDNQELIVFSDVLKYL